MKGGEIGPAVVPGNSANSLLVMERDSTEGGAHKTVYRVDLEGATNLLGRSTLSGGRSVEQLDPDSLTAAGVRAVTKGYVVNLAQLGWSLADYNGLALVDASTIAVIDDNNFNFGGYDSAGRLQLSGAPTRLTVVRLPAALR